MAASPIFDVNPSIYGKNLSLNINEYDNTMDFALVKETAPYYDLSAEVASEIILSTSKTVVDNWRNLAEKYRLSRSKMMDMRPAFMAAQAILSSEKANETDKGDAQKKRKVKK